MQTVEVGKNQMFPGEEVAGAGFDGEPVEQIDGVCFALALEALTKFVNRQEIHQY